MNLTTLQNNLQNLPNVRFLLPNRQFVPQHFHITEVGEITKKYIDCGGTIRTESRISLQLLHANDLEHRISAQKLLDIIDLSNEKLNLPDAEVEVELQGETIQKFGLEFDGNNFILTNLFTDCLAPDKCGIEEFQKRKVSLSELTSNKCTPNSGCC